MAFEPFMQILRGIQGRRNHGGISDIQNSQQMAYLRHLQKEIDKEKEDTMNISLKKLNVVVFDIETTGFYPEKGDSILSIGATKMCGSNIYEGKTFYSLIQYDKQVPTEITELTGITNEQVKNAPPLADVLIKFLEFIQDSTLVAHHSNHEKTFMQHASLKCFRTPFKHRIVDTSFLYKLIEPKMNGVTLDYLCTLNNIQIVDRHNALGDAKMTAEIWGIYIEKVLQLGCETLNDVYRHLALKHY